MERRRCSFLAASAPPPFRALCDRVIAPTPSESFRWPADLFKHLAGLASARSLDSHPTGSGGRLVPRLLTLLPIQTGADVQDHQRFRASIPAHLWSWKTICGWPWPATEKDYINRYELRAVYTALRWRVLRRKELKARFIHLTDSMVCLHVVSRGRSSSRKIQSLMYRIASLLLCAGLHPFLCYVSSATNPADAPSRRLSRVKRKWAK